MGQANPSATPDGRGSLVAKTVAVLFVALLALASYNLAPYLVRVGWLPSQDRSDAFQGLGFESVQLVLSVGSLLVSLFFILDLSDRLRDRTESYFAGGTAWTEVMRWREVLAAAISAAFAFVFATAQSKIIVTSSVFSILLVVAFIYFFIILITLSIQTKPSTFTSTRQYWLLLFVSVVLPYGLAAMFSTLSPAISAANIGCPGVAVLTPLEPQIWSSNPTERRVISGTYRERWYESRLHVFGIFVTNTKGESFDGSWYAGDVTFANDGTWESKQLYINAEDVIDFTVVAVDPDSATQTLIDYHNELAPGRDGVFGTTDDLSGTAFPRSLPDSDLPVCGHVRAYGTVAWEKIAPEELGVPTSIVSARVV